MEFLPPQRYPLWKQQLLDGQVDAGTAAQVGRLLATLHNATAGRPEVAAAFDCVDNFIALRLDPYLLATAVRHPDLQPALAALVESTAQAQIAPSDGERQPKNILVGPDGRFSLDAERAGRGDPAFDHCFLPESPAVESGADAAACGRPAAGIRCDGAQLLRGRALRAARATGGAGGQPAAGYPGAHRRQIAGRYLVGLADRQDLVRR